jgi:hypothetical protein
MKRKSSLGDLLMKRLLIFPAAAVTISWSPLLLTPVAADAGPATSAVEAATITPSTAVRSQSFVLAPRRGSSRFIWSSCVYGLRDEHG